MIPPLLHVIWIQGRDEMPKKYENNISKWLEINPNLKLEFWDEKRYIADNPVLIQEYHKTKNYGFKADIMKIHILGKYGGIYVDCDTMPINPIFSQVDSNSKYVHCCYLLTNNKLSKLALKYKKLFDVYFMISPLGHNVWDTFNLEILNSNYKTNIFRIGPSNDPMLIDKVMNKCNNVIIMEDGLCVRNVEEAEDNTICVHHCDATWIGDGSASVFAGGCINILRDSDDNDVLRTTVLFLLMINIYLLSMLYKKYINHSQEKVSTKWQEEYLQTNRSY
jgi:hypothetical protein